MHHSYYNCTNPGRSCELMGDSVLPKPVLHASQFLILLSKGHWGLPVQKPLLLLYLHQYPQNIHLCHDKTTISIIWDSLVNVTNSSTRKKENSSMIFPQENIDIVPIMELRTSSTIILHAWQSMFILKAQV